MAEAEGIRTRCGFCGEVTVPAGSLRCELDPAGPEAVCEFSCPICSRLILVGTGALEALALLAAGARGMPGRAALEVAEPHTGSPVTWDEVLDVHLALARNDFPQQELLP